MLNSNNECLVVTSMKTQLHPRREVRLHASFLFEQRKTGDFLERPFYFSFLAPWEKSCLRKTNEKLKERKKNENDLILFDQNETIFYPLRSFFFFLIKKKGKRSIKLVRIPRNVPGNAPFSITVTFPSLVRSLRNKSYRQCRN